MAGAGEVVVGAGAVVAGTGEVVAGTVAEVGEGILEDKGESGSCE